mmetsp:Transcript_10313/g.17698  ORF Transcript_10313/g.17698 Transcript_10313/m.17698 type:complete len:208 (-) Transcript_10313:276-899(-)
MGRGPPEAAWLAPGALMSAIILPTSRINMHVANGVRSPDRINCWIIFVTASLSFCLIMYISASAWNWTILFGCSMACPTSFTHRRTTSPFWYKMSDCAEVSAADATYGLRSTISCFKYLSIAWTICASVILHKTLVAFARYMSMSELMSLVKQLVTIITSSAVDVSSLIAKYTRRRNEGSADWSSLVTAKNTVVASSEDSFSPWATR